MLKTILEKAEKIKLIIFDVDGVLTDRQIYLADHGQYIAFNSHDGFGIKAIMRTGVQVGIITGRNSSVVALRMQELGVSHVYQGQEDKMSAFNQLLTQLNLVAEQVAYVGDDLPDLPIMRRAGLGIAVADAAEFVRRHADWQTQAQGGRGAAREVCELIMRAQNSLENTYEQYL